MLENEQQPIFSVSELNSTAKAVLEKCFSSIGVLGEISNCSRPSSGHIYFSLKDDHAQIRCAFFRNSQRGLNFQLENGQQILVRGQISLYTARGDYQLIVSHAELAGDGALQIAFAQLKAKLELEGLFDARHKKPLPLLPKQIGVVTSSSGAAIRDVLKVLNRRFPSIPVIIYPSLVQGKEAAGQIVAAIELANARQECDVILLTRGGGSLEDLWPFNEESVARAIFASQIPIVSAIGHEVDFTIADFVADLRAPTPSAAAECLSPNKFEWLARLTQYQQRVAHLVQQTLRQAQFHLTSLQKQLRHPLQQIQFQAQRLDQIEQQLTQALKVLLEKKTAKLTQQLIALNALSPLSTLERGYAIVQKGHAIIYDSDQLKKGDRITTKLAKGAFDAEVI